MSVLDTARAYADCRGLTRRQVIQKVGQLVREADNAACQMVAMATEVDELKASRDEAQDNFDQAAVAYSGILEDLRGVTDQLAVANAELAELRAFKANATAVDVPPMERDTRAVEDQATGPIDVRPLHEAAAAGLLGPVVRVSTSGTSADPGHVPVASGRGGEDTQPLTTVKGVAS
ncbi:hypothetical protein [Streptomyces sp. NPDC055243]|uniref:hypothetical protein n=1 Tax=Streptomyces sp. NPDC055243 TaxID=3365720 RepID=UPI0037D8FC39